MKLTGIANSKNGHWFEVHKCGCSDIKKATGRGNAFDFEANSKEEAAKDLGFDFIEEGSMTIKDVLDQTHFAPCTKDLK